MATDCSVPRCPAGAPIPRIVMNLFVALFVTTKAGINSDNSPKSLMAFLVIVSPSIAATDIGMSCALCARFVATTTISSNTGSSCAKADIDVINNRTAKTNGLVSRYIDLSPKILSSDMANRTSMGASTLVNMALGIFLSSK